jgi:hypothetical protein
MTTPSARAAVGRFDTVVFDCPDPPALAQFYAGLLGQEIADGGFRVYADPAGHPFCLCR